MDGIGGGSAPPIGSPARATAVAALRTHLEAGRLTPEEYEDRSVTASRARPWGELAPGFADLPDPRPGPVAAHLAPPAPASAGAFPALSEGVKERIMAVTPLAAL